MSKAHEGYCKYLQKRLNTKYLYRVISVASDGDMLHLYCPKTKKEFYKSYKELMYGTKGER